jgi:hypothetical protein
VRTCPDMMSNRELRALVHVHMFGQDEEHKVSCAATYTDV